MKNIICYFFDHIWDKIAEYEDGTSKQECKRCGKIEYWEEYIPKFYRRLS